MRVGFNNCLDVCSPGIQCGSLLVCPVVPLIDAGNSATAAAEMIQRSARHLKSHTALQSPCAGQAQAATQWFLPVCNSEPQSGIASGPRKAAADFVSPQCPREHFRGGLTQGWTRESIVQINTYIGAPGKIRTSDPQIRSLVLFRFDSSKTEKPACPANISGAGLILCSTDAGHLAANRPIPQSDHNRSAQETSSECRGSVCRAIGAHRGRIY
jgi:hypothetical protein